jgi:hypothetical protein
MTCSDETASIRIDKLLGSPSTQPFARQAAVIVTVSLIC